MKEGRQNENGYGVWYSCLDLCRALILDIEDYDILAFGIQLLNVLA
jgi:hypothetical protein